MKPAALFGSVRWIVLTASFCPSSCPNDWHGGLWEATTFYGIGWSDRGLPSETAPHAWDNGQHERLCLQDVGRCPRNGAKYGCRRAIAPHTATCVRNATVRRDHSRRRRFSIPAHDSAPDPAVESRFAHAVAWRLMPRDGEDGLPGHLPRPGRRVGRRNPSGRGSTRSRSAGKSISSLRGCQKNRSAKHMHLLHGSIDDPAIVQLQHSHNYRDNGGGTTTPGATGTEFRRPAPPPWVFCHLRRRLSSSLASPRLTPGGSAELPTTDRGALSSSLSAS
jgi:hypothetical protein